MNRRDAVLGLVALGAVPAAAFAQQQVRIRRIGFLSVRSRPARSNPDPYFDAFMHALRELGYVEGKNLVVEWRFADGKFERLPGLAVELVGMNLEVLLTHTTPSTDALRRATNTIPIVMTSTVDPVGSGFAASLGRPGGNITGLSIMTLDLSPKILELLKVMVPALSRAIVFVNPSNPTHSTTLKRIQDAARQLGVKILPVEVRTAEEIERGFASLRRERADAVIVPADGFFTGQWRQFAELAARHRLPSINPMREFVDAGGLMSYGQNITDSYRRAAAFVDKILKGANPGELPIEQPSKIHLAINRNTAKALGITIPQELLLRADEVIE